MAHDRAISNHYTHGNLLESIQTAIITIGKTPATVTLEELATVDEFHIGGRQATEHLLSQLNFPDHARLIDVGCGLGGAARFVAHKYNHHISGIDLTPEYIETGNVLNGWLGLENQVELHQGNALALPFGDETFDGGFTMHASMNIENKAKLFSEIYRVLRPGSTFGLYDIMKTGDGELAYPVPWATEPHTSSLASPEEYQQGLRAAGFSVLTENNRHQYALEFFMGLAEKAAACGGPPPMGLHLLMEETTATKIKNMIENIKTNKVSPVEIIARK
jgi:ubiquinone/menaquinone biosynthesis C-methylase UbiE